MLTISILLLAIPLAVVQAAPTVNLGLAQYQGAVDAATNITSFLGIRYAAPPLGDLRFRAPAPPLNTSGVQLATVQPNQCLQSGFGQSSTNPLKPRAASVVPSEDCLFLNVYYPSDAVGTPPKGLPTLVWIHGGGYALGGASSYNGEDIIAQSNRGVVVVVIQYRLGLFGFLAGAEVKENGALNAGLLDQDFALRFVNQHITQFGGDPEKVTIWGESAGAGSVLQHVLANGGRTVPQLFRGAITSSTFLPPQYEFDDPIIEFLFSEVVSQANCSSAANALTCLRSADTTLLSTVNANINSAGFFGTFSTVPVIDGEFIVQRPTLSLLEGCVNGQALLSITNTFEGTIFVNQTTGLTAAEYSLALFPKFTQTQANIVSQLYAGLGTDVFQVNAIQSESIFVCPTYYMQHAFFGRSFKGEFAIPPGLHGSDVAYYFPSAGGLPPFNNTQFIDAFAQSFTSFIINHDPNIKVSNTITPQWNKFVAGNTEMLFNQTAAMPPQPDVRPIKTDNALLQRCQFWHSVGHLTGQ
ncbi:Alpha/Beta hydrolase protein [Roridomyces roridus]|uniref:Carboxylic ester hydrolase n=1 Tax=Roridomyces roridus TaxID=1738132 RepID=A0AAD7G390_9AGAR|nr:Alpha/Beta hydrolase protein [Roridomyces roridus]